MGRDAPRPDATRRLRRAAKGKGGAVWRRDRSRAQPRAGPLGPSMASTARTHPLPVASTVALHARAKGILLGFKCSGPFF